ncbi:MAG TPA: acyl-CoA reductase [Chryseolinea sp.]
MSVDERISAFDRLGTALVTLTNDEFKSLAFKAGSENPWFTEDNIRMAVSSLHLILSKQALIDWTSSYDFKNKPKKVAVVMAGNIPLVGFHDFLCVLISGNSILIKSSSKDNALIHFVVDQLISIEPRFGERIEFAERLKGFDAIIATGSDNTSRYFEYYFGKYPNIIRRNRTSVAVLKGNESNDEIKDLGIDIFSYFGLGCRNVSKLFVPPGFSLHQVFTSWQPYHDVIYHHKYCNNYDYQKSIMLVGRIPFFDGTYVMLHETEKLVSPISVLYFEYYNGNDDLKSKLDANREKIQCIVDNSGEFSTIKFGRAQFPGPGDYADQIDTLKFLTGLN